MALVTLFEPPVVTDRETQVVGKIDELRKRLRHLARQPGRWTGLLRRNTLALAIQGSNSIEGYNVTNEDAIAAVAGEDPLEADEVSWAAVTGYREAMTYVLQLADDPHFAYSAGLLRSLHYMMLRHDLTRNPGKWRPGSIYVRRDGTGEIVYEGPDVDQVPYLIDALLECLNDGGDPTQPAVVRAALGHLNLVMIHPFSDGNGRMARCLQTLMLAREGILEVPFSSVEEYLGRNTPEYYRVLAQVGGGSWQPENDTRPWVRFMLTAHYRQATTLLRRSQEMEAVWTALEEEAARHGLPERMLMALSDAAFGYRVRNSTYRAAASISSNTASRDLTLLIKVGLLVPHGEKRGRTYIASAQVRALRERLRRPKSAPDPFGDTGGPGE